MQEGTNVGGFLPSFVQYHVLKGRDYTDLDEKLPIIDRVFREARRMIEAKWKEDRDTAVVDLGIKAFGGIGVAYVGKPFSTGFTAVKTSIQTQTERSVGQRHRTERGAETAPWKATTAFVEPIDADLRSVHDAG